MHTVVLFFPRIIGIDNVGSPVQAIPVCSNVWEHSKFFFAVVNVFLLSALDFGVSFIEAFNKHWIRSLWKRGLQSALHIQKENPKLSTFIFF